MVERDDPGGSGLGSWPEDETAPAGAADARRWPSGSRLAIAVAALIAHLFLGAIYAFSAVVAPAWVVMLLMAWWAMLLGGGWTLGRLGSRLVLLVPVIALLTWILVLGIGSTFFEWSA